MAETKPEVKQTAWTIAAVERDTGLSKDILRVWERRYGFPHPSRDDCGERVYPAEQVVRLRLIQRLISQGQRPGRVVPLPHDQLQQALQTSHAATPSTTLIDASQQALLDLLKQHDLPHLRHTLHQALMRMGLARFIQELVAPMNILVGEAWMQDQIEVFEEHMYTECITGVLRGAISAIPRLPGSRGPRVLLTTFPQESHALGLLMAEALFALEGCDCVSLGVQMPIPEIAQAARANQANLIGLSFSSSLNAKQVLQGLTELREKTPSEIGIWAGGSHPVLQRTLPAGISRVTSLQAIRPQLEQWSADMRRP